MAEPQKRPEWNEYFLDIAKAVGRRSTCLRRRYGAIIVKDKIIISTGRTIALIQVCVSGKDSMCPRDRIMNYV